MTVHDTITAELMRIGAELEKLKRMTIHVGIVGIPGKNAFQKGVYGSEADLITIARVHEYGANIRVQHAKSLTIPIHKKSYGKRVKDFPDLFYIEKEENDDIVKYGVVYKNKRTNSAGSGSQKAETSKGKAVSEGERVSSKRASAKKQKTVKILEESEKEKIRQKRKEARKANFHSSNINEDELEFLFLCVPSVKIPERSYIRASYDKNKEELCQACETALYGIIQEGWDARQAAEYIGGKGVDIIRLYMSKPANFKPKGEIQRGVSKTYADTPLHVTNRLFNSITYWVEEG